MPNYFVSYDLNGQTPTHTQMDAHLKKIGECVHRILETVWYINSSSTEEEIFKYANSILSANDGLVVVTASGCRWRDLLVSDQALQACWKP